MDMNLKKLSIYTALSAMLVVGITSMPMSSIFAEETVIKNVMENEDCKNGAVCVNVGINFANSPIKIGVPPDECSTEIENTIEPMC